MVIVDQGLAEGVYADSGAGCYGRRIRTINSLIR